MFDPAARQIIEEKLAKLTPKATLGLSFEMIEASGFASDAEGFRLWLEKQHPAKFTSRTVESAGLVQVRLAPA